MCEVKVINQLLIRRGFFEGVQVNSMEIFYNSLFQRESVIDVILDKYRNDLKSSEPGRSPSTFSRDQLEEVCLTLNRSNDDRLQNPQFTY